MLGLLTKSQIKRILIQLETSDHRDLIGKRGQMYFDWGVSSAVSYIRHRLGIAYEDVELPARENNGE